jgi:hypothetical protein
MISRFFATTGTLTPALLFSDSRAGLPGSLLPELPDIPSPTTPCAPAFRLCFLLRAGLASDSLRQLSAVLRISLIMCSLISRIRPNRVRRARLSSASSLRAVRSLSVALHEASLARSYFPLLAGSSAKEGLAPSRSSMLPGAHMPLLNGACVPWGAGTINMPLLRSCKADRSSLGRGTCETCRLRSQTPSHR